VHAYRSRGLASAVVHPGWVYGPGDRAFLPALVRQIATGILPLWGPAGSSINLVYVEDLVDALVTAGDSPAARNEDFLVLDETSDVGLDDLCRRAAAFLGIRHRPVQVPYALAYAVAVLSQGSARLGLVRRPPFTTTDVRSFGHRFRFSTAKARRLLGWSPRTPFRDGIDAALRWYAADAGVARRARGARVERHAGPGSRPAHAGAPPSRRRPSARA
jgi:nucleoside-diphosphate-sugar epimerase